MKKKNDNQVEVKTEEKIGFNTNPPLAKGQKVEKFQETLPGKGLRRATKLCTIFGIIFSSLSMMYFMLPIFSAFLGGIIAIIIVMFMIVSVVFSLGMVLTIDDYRHWIGNNMMDVPNFFFNLGENVAKLAPFYLVVAIPALVLNIAGFVLSIIGQSKHYKYFISYIILNSVFLSFSLLFTVIYFISGMNVFQA